MKDVPPTAQRFHSDRQRDPSLVSAIAYCGTCNQWEPVNDKLTGYRFDCPLWKLDDIHVAAVIGTRWAQARWVRRISCLESYQAFRGRSRSRGARVLAYLTLTVVLGLALGIAWLMLPSPWLPFARTIAVVVGILLIVDTLLFTSANALSSQRPRFPPRSIFRSVLGLGQLLIGFSLLHAGLGSELLVGGRPTYLDLWRGLYFSTVTMATVGYGDIAPPVEPLKLVFWLVILQIVSGVYYLSIFVATMVSWARGIQRPLTLSELLEESDRLDQDEKEKAAKGEKLRKGIRVTGMVHRFIIGGFDEIEDFNEFMKSAIKREQDLTSRRIEEGASRLDEEEREQYYEFFSEDYQKIGDVFEKLALDSFVVMLYSRVETGMAALCDALRQDRQKQKGEKINLRYSDLKAWGYLDQAKLYMEKVLGVDLDLGNNAQWSEIRGLQTLRNAIVHDEGWLSSKDGALKKHIEWGFIELKQREDESNGKVSGRVRVKSAYVDYILPQVRKFFQDIKI